jgi:16S rRNA (guanine527-N7)-methyltransferase
MAEPSPKARRELPVDPWASAPMGEAFEQALESGLRDLGLVDASAGAPWARRSYEAHARLLREWGDGINLTGIRRPADVARRHVCDSLSAVRSLAHMMPPGASLLDLGSGSGYPGLPLAAALPVGRVGLLESVRKKARFLAAAAAAVREVLRDGPADAVDAKLRIESIAERAEDLAEEPAERAAWDIVAARAVGSLAEVLELALPLTREGGLVVAWKREDDGDGLRRELRDAGSIIRAAGGGRPEVVVVEAAGLAGHRLVLVPKERPTPVAYPRPAALRRHR